MSRKKLPRNFQEIEELRRICCEETDRARQLRRDELSMQQERHRTTVSQLFTQNSGFTEQVRIPWPMQENFTILRLRAALEHPTFPANP